MPQRCQRHQGPPGRTSSPEWLLLASLSLEGGPSCLLLFQEAPQDLTKAPFKLLPLSLDSGHVGFCVHPLWTESLFPPALCSSVHKPSWPSKPGVLAPHLPGCSTDGLGVQCGAQIPFSLGAVSAVVISLTFLGCLFRVWSTLYCISTFPLLPSHGDSCCMSSVVEIFFH